MRGNPYINSRNFLVWAWLTIVYDLLWGLFALPIFVFSYGVSENETALQYVQNYWNDLLMTLVFFLILHQILILFVAFRQKIGIFNFILRFVVVFVAVRFIAFLTLGSMIINNLVLQNVVLLVLWAMFALALPIVAIRMLPKMHREYKINLPHKAAFMEQKKKLVRRNDSYPTRPGNSYRESTSDRWNDMDYSSFDNGGYNSYEAYDSYNSYDTYYYDNFGSYYNSTSYYDDTSYEAYKQSETYYTSADSYAIYESYYNG